MTGFEINAPRIVWDRGDDEVIALDCVAGVYYRLGPAASDVWRAIDAGATLQQLQEAGVEATQLSGFLEELRTQMVLRERAEPLSHAAAITVRGGALDYQRFDDLQEILEADPIHEVEPDQGWPQVR